MGPKVGWQCWEKLCWHFSLPAVCPRLSVPSCLSLAVCPQLSVPCCLLLPLRRATGDSMGSREPKETRGRKETG